MRKWNAILSISIVAVLLIPVMMAGSIASACCGVKPVDLVVSEDPTSVCTPMKVTIYFKYNVVPDWPSFTPYDTGVIIRIWNPAGVKIVNEEMTLATGQTTVPKSFGSKYVLDATMAGIYNYEVLAWSQNSFGRMQTEVVAGKIGENCVRVPVDIRPTSCPNPLNLGEKGVLPVAILGTNNLDVSKIDLESIMLMGVKPLRSALEDVATPQPPAPSPPAEPCSYCNTLGPDGYMDLTLKFDAEAIISVLNKLPQPLPDCMRLTLRGTLKDGRPMMGGDSVVIIAK
jgi:hypothetical protein